VRVRRATFATFVALSLVAAACAGDDDSASSGDTSSTEGAADRSGEAAYAEPGPYDVGLTTVQLADRVVEVVTERISDSTVLSEPAAPTTDIPR